VLINVNILNIYSKQEADNNCHALDANSVFVLCVN